MESIEKEFEVFFESCKQQGFSSKQMLSICQPLIWRQRMRRAKMLAKMAIFLGAIYCLYSWCDSFAWLLSAIGRLLLIQLLPFWDWTPLYTNKCLIERAPESAATPTRVRLGKYETESENCVLCETLERMPVAFNVTYSHLETVYLERGYPVIVTDSHVPQALPQLLDVMQHASPEFIESEPCDLASNLLLKKLFNLELALHKIRSSSAGDKWFLQLRNCRFSAVKASRLFITRPYYYPLHLEPFYSSWVLMSQNYADRLQEIFLQGLVFVQQLSGSFDMVLSPKQPCSNACPTISIRLEAGECLVFSTDLWIFSYGTKTIGNRTTAIATVAEIDWQL